MLVVKNTHRRLGVAKMLVEACVNGMNCREIVLETQVTNVGSLKLYDSLGFIRDKLLKWYYLDGSSAYRLKLIRDVAPDDQVDDSF